MSGTVTIERRAAGTYTMTVKRDGETIRERAGIETLAAGRGVVIPARCGYPLGGVADNVVGSPPRETPRPVCPTIGRGVIRTRESLPEQTDSAQGTDRPVAHGGSGFCMETSRTRGSGGSPLAAPGHCQATQAGG